jgi:formate-dependent nitrite reductase cytochrome c552 subunit
MTKLREAARGQSCVRCARQDETVVLAHYTGARRHAYDGGFGIKVHDLIGAHLCADCHKTMDTIGRSKQGKWEHSEEFLHLCALTIIRLYKQGIIK